jgi:hypothetical protein
MKKISITIKQVTSLLNYFGYEHIRTANGTWEYRHKHLAGNFCNVTQKFGSMLAAIEFRFGLDPHKTVRQSYSQVKSWEGLFNAVRTQTRSLIYKRDVYQYHNQNRTAA